VLRRKFALAMTLAVAASLMLAGGALAHGKDRNHDRIPDRWEKHHHLSLHHKQGRRDQDHDGLKNRGEFRAHLNPRDADTDNDGIDDGDENAGTVASFEDSMLTITLANGGSLTAAVDDGTEIKCDATPGDDRGHDEGDDDGDHHGDGPGDDDQGDDQGDDDGDGDHGDDRALADHHGDHGDDDAEDCGTDALVAGTKVLEAELKVRDGDAFWTEVELLSPTS
jgi:hypothetical protein